MAEGAAGISCLYLTSANPQITSLRCAASSMGAAQAVALDNLGMHCSQQGVTGLCPGEETCPGHQTDAPTLERAGSLHEMGLVVVLQSLQ
ncbi:hypothetical protein KC336_g87 [Hortaea werneckii]|nr:hypothetical protein KC336_g87 [Hortaea werneckii]